MRGMSSVESTPRQGAAAAPFATPISSHYANGAHQATTGVGSTYQVQIPPGVRVELLPRMKGDSTVRLADNTLADLIPGMYVMAAVQGRTRISFYKLPESVVRKELDRLQSSGFEYGLVLTNLPPQATPNAAAQQFHTPSVYGTPSVAISSGARPGGSVKAPPGTGSSAGFIASELKDDNRKGYQSGNDRLTDAGDSDYQYEEDAGDDRLGELVGLTGTANLDKAFLESVERLRSQRRAVEAIKRESQQKTLKIESLTAELREVQLELAETRDAFESLRRTATTTESLEEALAQERSRNAKLERDYEKIRADMKLLEGNYASELARVRAERDEERVALQNALEESRMLNSEAQVRIEEFKKSLAQLVEERDASEAREEQTRRAFERLANEQREREVRGEHASERLRNERDKALRHVEELEAQLAVARGQITAQREAADSGKERIVLMERTVAEVEENCRELRNQLAETESRAALRVREYETENERLRRELDSVLLVKEESRKAREELRGALDEETRAHRASREELVAMEGAKREAEEACERALRQAKLAHERVTEISKQKDLLHERLVRALAKGNALADELEEERRAAKALAETRLELLAQFVEEERRLDGTLMMSANPVSASVQKRRAERKLEFASPTRTGGTAFSRRTGLSVSETPDLRLNRGLGLKQ